MDPGGRERADTDGDGPTRQPVLDPLCRKGFRDPGDTGCDYSVWPIGDSQALAELIFVERGGASTWLLCVRESRGRPLTVRLLTLEVNASPSCVYWVWTRWPRWSAAARSAERRRLE